jgi:MFS family permease
MSEPQAAKAHAALGLGAIFTSTFLELMGVFMLSPLMLLRLKAADVSTAMAGLFAATSWLGIFLMTPFASAVTRRLGRRPTLWLAAILPVFAGCGFALIDTLPVWYALVLASGMSGGLRWVLAEAIVAEFSAPQRRGRNVGIFETMVGATFVLGPALLAWVGATNPVALWIAIGFLAAGFAGTLLVPRLPTAGDMDSTRVGLHGVWLALRAHPIIMLAGFAGGFFESGVTSILPLYGLALGLGVAASALLVSASGLGSTLMMLPAGMLADRWRDPAQGRRNMMVLFAAFTLLASCAVPFVVGIAWLAWPMVFIWGGCGGCLYTLAMIDIGSREAGINLVNSTAVLVLSYTLGSVLASASASAMLQFAPLFGFPALLILVAAVGLGALFRTRHRVEI